MAEQKLKRYTPAYYGIVFGLRGNSNKYENIDGRQSFKVREDNSIVVMDMVPPLKDNVLRDMLQQFATVFNKVEHGLLTYHDGESDGSCSYNGKHWHAIMELNLHPTRDARWGRNLLALAKSNQDIFFACETVQSVKALARHILTQPRIKIACRGRELAGVVATAGEEGFPEIVPSDKAKITADKNHYRIQYLKELMSKFRTADITAVKSKIINDKAMWEKYMEIMSLTNFDVICKKAVEQYRTEICHRTLEQVFAEPDVKWRDDPQLFPITESLAILDNWLSDNHFDRREFLEAIFNTLERKIPKKNTFCLWGPPNAGKSYILRSLISWFQYFGEVRGGANYAFLWQDCIDTAVIFIEEPCITPDIVEQCKLVFEGAPTRVHVKMRGDALLEPTPVFITCNSMPWKWCGGEEGALRARMHFYACKEMPCLKGHKKYLNPLIWPYLYHLVKSDQEIKRVYAKGPERDKHGQFNWIRDKEILQQYGWDTPDKPILTQTPKAPKRQRSIDYVPDTPPDKMARTSAWVNDTNECELSDGVIVNLATSLEEQVLCKCPMQDMHDTIPPPKYNECLNQEGCFGIHVHAFSTLCSCPADCDYCTINI